MDFYSEGKFLLLQELLLRAVFMLQDHMLSKINDDNEYDWDKNINPIKIREIIL